MNIPKKIPFTKEGYQKLSEDKEKLLQERKDALEDLKKARDMGDLSENGYYKAAKAKISSLDHQLHRLQYLLRYGEVTVSVPSDSIQLGSKVTVTDEHGEKEFLLVGQHEANPSENKISVRSPIGAALLGKKLEEPVSIQTPAGIKHYTVKRIR